MARAAKLRIIVALHLEETPLRLLEQAKGIQKRMAGNEWFPSPKPSLSFVQARIDDLDAAQTAMATRRPGTFDDRNGKQDALAEALRQLGKHVQDVATANPDDADEIIASAGFHRKKSSAKKPKQAFVVKPGRSSGSARLIAKAVAKRATYEWYMSRDGKTWSRAASTLGASTTVQGLAPGGTYYFRVRATTKTGPRDFSRAVRFIAR